ncbi:MAG: glucose-6-phosphate isomerase, partial [Alphaproteobacteria bacterium]|nr:glucose-6-phosphate isomerase [Alphaproteobacteria bacterium]
MLGDLPYRQDLSRSAAITASAAFEAALAAAGEGLAALRRAHDDGSVALLRLAESQGDLAMIEARAEHHREHADDVVVLGTGGSSLGGQALYALADSGFGPSGDSPRLNFLDNIDPHNFEHLFGSP